MAAIEQIFRDFVVNKIKEIEESQDASPTEEQQSNGLVTTEGATATIPQDKEDASLISSKEDGDVLHKKHKKHKKHKSKKKKRRKEDRNSSSESAVDSEGAAQHGDSNGREQPSDRPNEPQTGVDEKTKRRKRHSSRKKKKKKHRKDEDRTGSSTESEAEPGAREEPARREGEEPAANGTSQDLLSSAPKESGRRRSPSRSRSGSRSARRRPRSGSKSGHRSRRSRSRRSRSRRSRSRRSRSRRSRSRRSRSRSRSRSGRRSRSRSGRRSRRTRSRSVVVLRRDRKSRSPYRSRSRTRRRRTKSRSMSPSRRHRSTSRESASRPKEAPLAERDASVVKEVVSECEPADEPKNLPVPDEPPALPDASSSQEEPTNSGVWKPLPLLEVKVDAVLSTPQASEPLGSPQKCPVPPEVPLAPPASDPEPGASEGPPDPLSHGPSKEVSSSAGETGASRSGSPQSSSQQAPGDGHKPASKAEDKPAVKKSRRRKSKSRTPSHRKRSSRSRSRGRTKRSRSRSPKRRHSRSRSVGRRSRRSRSRSGSRRRRGTFASNTLSQRDRWKREPSHSPVLILRKKRSPARTQRSTSKSPPRITELDKDQLLEIAKANAAAMCAKAGMPIPDSLRPKAVIQLPLNLPLNLPAMAMNAAMASMTAATMTAALSSMGALASLPQMAPLPSITNKPPPGPPQPNMAAIEEAKRKVSKQANIISIKEFTDKCKKIVESKGELAVAQPHHSDEEEEGGKPFGGASLREVKAISFSINNASVRPAAGARSDAAYAKEFPVSSGSQHRKKEGEGAYGEWVPVEKKAVEKAKALAAVKAAAVVAKAAAASGEAASGVPLVVKPVLDEDSVFPEPPLQPVDITQAVSERIKAQRRLAENPYDVNAICMLTRAQEQVDAWAQSNTIPGLFTGSTGAQVLSSEELSNSGPQAWIKKGQSL